MSNESTATSAGYLAYQYGDAEKLRVRYETHQRYSVQTVPFLDWAVHALDVMPGMRVLDVGCGPGSYHPLVAARGARVVALDASAGMTSEAAAQARALSLDVSVALGNAPHLPIANAIFDRVMANHMLYHVLDQEAALRELRRVTGAGGRVMLATNARSESNLMFQLHDRAARDCGFTPLPLASSRFTLDDLPLVRSVLPSARVLVREDAFVFPNAEPFLAYYASYQVDEVAERSEDGVHRPPLLHRMRELVEGVIAREGRLEVPKVAGCFIADV